MSLVTIDQVISGASNFAVVIFVAHVLAPAEFGLFTLIYLSFAIALVAGRALVSGTVLAHPEDVSRRPGAILGSASAFSLGVGALFGVTGGAFLLWNAAVGEAVLWLALAAPLLLVQDVGRYLAIASARPGRAIMLDVAWVVLEAAGFTLLVVRDAATLASSVAVWSGAGALAGLLVLAQYGVPRLTEIRPGWLRERWGFSWRSFLTSLIEQSGIVMVLVVIAAATTPVVVAAVQAVTILTRPGYTVILAIGQATVADVARDQPDNRAIWSYIRRAVVVTVAAALINLAVMLLVPDRLGRIILGQNWSIAEPLILATGLQAVFLALRSGFRAAMLGRRDAGTILRLELAGTLLMMPLLITGALLNGALGVAWAGVAGQAFLTAVWWLLFSRRLRSQFKGTQDTTVVPDAS